MIADCPVCGGDLSAPFFETTGAPALANALLLSQSSALAATEGAISLALCGSCTLIVNRAFDPSLIAYSADYENSLHHSPSFQRYAEELAERLVDRYGVRGGRVLEVGPGQGDFLGLLSKLGDNDALGFEPSHDPERRPSPTSDRVRIEAAPFPLDALDGEGEVDLACARHVLEHVADPLPLLRAMRASLVAPGGVAYVEVPDGAYLLDRTALWDVVYEHCVHHTEASLRALATTAGFEVLAAGRSFGDQFLWADLTVAAPAIALPDGATVRRAFDAAATFADRARALLERGSDLIERAARQGPVALWGVGSKGVSFLTMVDAAREIDAVVDVNPFKHGRFVPVSGHEVRAPDQLIDVAPATVVVLNPNYVAEVSEALAVLGIDAETVAP